MKVNFYATYRPIVGGKTIEFEIEHGTTVRDLLEAIVTRFPPLRDELLDPQGQLYPWIPLALNGRNPRLLADGVDSILQPDDVLSIFTPMASGRDERRGIKRAWKRESGEETHESQLFCDTIGRLSAARRSNSILDQGITVRQLVEAIITRFPAMQREMLDDTGNMYSHVHYLCQRARFALFGERAFDDAQHAGRCGEHFPAGGWRIKTSGRGHRLAPYALSSNRDHRIEFR